MVYTAVDYSSCLTCFSVCGSIPRGLPLSLSPSASISGGRLDDDDDYEGRGDGPWMCVFYNVLCPMYSESAVIVVLWLKAIFERFAFAFGKKIQNVKSEDAFHCEFDESPFVGCFRDVIWVDLSSPMKCVEFECADGLLL